MLMIFFEQALEESEIAEDAKNELMLSLNCFRESVCGPDEVFNMKTLTQVKKNPMYIKLIEDLLQKLAYIEDLADFVDPSSDKHNDILNRVACLLTAMGAEEFGISEKEME